MTLAALLLSGSLAAAAEFSSVKPVGEIDEIRVSGLIERGDLERLRAALASRSEPSRRVRLSLDSPGGHLREALELAAHVHGENIATYVADAAVCESACSIVFMAGSAVGEQEKYPDRMLHTGGRLGFHAPAFPKALFSEPGYVTAANVEQLERVMIQAAARFYDLTRTHQWQPSLVRAALSTTGRGAMTYVETVGQAGRWLIRLDAEIPLQVRDQSIAGALCGNLMDWITDGASTWGGSTSFYDFLPPPADPRMRTGGADTFARWHDEIEKLRGSLFGYEYGDGWRFGFEDMTEYCTIDTSAEGWVLDVGVYRDGMSPLFPRDPDAYGSRPAPGRRYMTWHALPDFVKLSDVPRYRDTPIVTESAWDHNDSKMRMVRGLLEDGSERLKISYSEPKPSLSGLVATNALLFEGTLRDGILSGEARTFRSNCPAAPYRVEERFDEKGFVLVGAAPVRARGRCEVTGYDRNSGNARLAFTPMN